MGWVSYLEDIKKRAEDLEAIVEQIHRGDIAYTDKNRARVKTISRQIWTLVGNLEKTLRSLGPADIEIIDENVSLKEERTKLITHKEHLESELKKAYEQVAKFKEDCEDEKLKHRFTIDKILHEGLSEVRHYLRSRGYH
ncbi:MAG: hypothetical protein ABSD46_03105 [Bacteroidota bacterium]